MSTKFDTTTCPNCQHTILRVFALRLNELLQCANCREILVVTKREPVTLKLAAEQMEANGLEIGT